MRESGPGGLDWRGHGRPPWDSKDLTADQNRRLSEFYRRGGVNPPRPHGGPEVNFTLISLKVESIFFDNYVRWDQPFRPAHR